MRVVLIHHFPGIGGGTISGLDVVRMLIELGHEVIMAVPNPGDFVRKSCDILGCKLDSVVSPPLFTYHNASSDAARCLMKYMSSLKAKRYWEDYFKKTQPDLVILNSAAQAPLISILKKLDIKCICTIRETYRLAGWRWVNKLLVNMISKADATLTLTEFDKKTWNCRNKVNAILPDVVDSKRYSVHTKSEIEDFKKRHKLIDDIKYIIYLGGISKAKGSLDLLKSYGLIAEKSNKIGLLLLGNLFNEPISLLFKLLHGSEVKYRKQCHNLINNYKERNLHVIDVGLVDDASLWYESSSVVAFPVLEVHQPRPAYEAGFYSLPIVLPDYENFAEYIKNGVNGVLYKKEDIHDLAAKILSIVENDKFQEQLGKNNFDACFNSHSFEKSKNQLKSVIDAIC